MITVDFNAANGTVLSALDPNWKDVLGNADEFWVQDNQVAVRQSFDFVAARYEDAGVFGINQWAEVRVSAVPTQYRRLGVVVRCQRNAATFYFLEFDNTTIKVGKYINGARTELYADTTFNPALNDVLRLEASGTTIRLLRNTNLVTNVTDTEITTAGDVGLFGQGAFSSTRADDFAGDAMQGPDITPPTVTRRDVTGITSSNATVEIDTDEPTRADITWSLNPGGNDGTAYGTNLTTAHRIQLIGLASGRTIYYRFVVRDAAGNATTGPEQSFVTQPGGPNQILNPLVGRVAYVTARIQCQTTRASSLRVTWSGGGQSGATDWSPPYRSHAVVLRGLPQGVTINYRIESDGAPAVRGQFDTQISTVQIGMNLGDPIDSDGHTKLFVDCHKKARPWVDNGFTPLQELTPSIPIDANGYPTQVPPNNPNGNGAPCFRTFVFDDLEGHYPAGDYTVIFTGDFSGVVFERDWTEVSRSGNRVTMRVTEPTNGGIGYRVESLNQADLLRGVRIIMPGEDENDDIHSEAAALLTNIDTLRSMDFQNINEENAHGSAGVARSYADVVPETYFSYNPGESQNDGASRIGVPYTMLVKLANATGRNLHICVPHRFSLADWTAMATDLLGLDSNLRLTVTYSNEVWNVGQFRQGAYTQTIAQSRNVPGNQYEAMWRVTALLASEIVTEVRRVFGARASQVEGVLECQGGRPDVARLGLEYLGSATSNLDWLFVNHYVGEYLGISPVAQQVENWEPEQVLDELRSHLFDQGLTDRGLKNQNGTPALVSGAWKRLADHRALAQQYGLRLGAYEGGQHLAGVAAQQNNTKLEGVFTTTNRDPRMFDHYCELVLVAQLNGVEWFNHFSFLGRYSKYGSWGAQEYDDVPVTSNGAKLHALQLLSAQGVNAPSGLTVSQAGPGALRADWTNNATGATAVRVERRAEGGQWAVVATLSATTTSHTETSLAAGSNHDFRVQAVRGTAVSPYSATVRGTVQGGGGGTRLNPPDGLSVSPDGPGTLTLRFTSRAVGHDGHRVERRDVTAQGEWIAVDIPATQSEAMFTGAEAEHHYDFRVAALLASDTGSLVGEWSETVRATALPADGGELNRKALKGRLDQLARDQAALPAGMVLLPDVNVAVDPTDLYDLIVHGELR